MKNVIILIILFFVIRAIKKRFIDAPTLPREPKEAPKSPKSGAGPAKPEGEEMVLDPACNSYVAVSSAIPANVGGRTEYFCSQECRDRFLASK